MINIQTINNKGYKWHSNGKIYAKGFIFDNKNNLYQNDNILNFFSGTDDEELFRAKLASANGQFAVIIEQDGNIMAATDIMRSFPLFYKIENENITISDEIESISCEAGAEELDTNSELIFRATGYATGSDTLIKDVKQIEAGQYISFCNKQLSKTFYHSFIKETININLNEAKVVLREIFEHISERLAILLNGRPVAIPLSGGLDSRLIALILNKIGYKNVICFTYGSHNAEIESERARKVAESLGFDWHFINYDLYQNVTLTADREFVDYVKYASQHCSKFYMSEYLAAQHLKNELHLSDETVIIPGHSGDSISGSHLRPYMNNYRNISTIAKDITYSQFNLITQTAAERRKCKAAVKKQLSQYEGRGYRKFENWIMKERQSKYIVNSCRIWEFNGFEFALPLWDRELVDFLMTLPFELRLYQNLYSSTLKDIFTEKGIWFSQDEKTHENSIKQYLKIIIKRIVPDFHKKNNVFVGDYYGFKESAKEFINALPEPEKIRSYNGIFTEWYINAIENKNL